MALHLTPKPNQIRVKMLSKRTHSVWSYGLNSKANCYLAFHDELVFAFVGALYPYKCSLYKKQKIISIGVFMFMLVLIMLVLGRN